MAAAQYNVIAPDYAAMDDLPSEIVSTNLLRSKLKELPHGLRVLDLAGGTGTYARMALDLGVANSVTVVDISSEMLRVGKGLDEGKRRIEYLLGDCMQPLGHLGLEPDSFDLVMGNYLFNYASTRQQLSAMWQNVVTYLKPGGTFVGLIPGLDVKKHLKRGPWCGLTYEHVEDLEESVKVNCIFHCKPGIQFNNYILEASLYETVPLERGMKDIAIHSPTVANLPATEGPSEAAAFEEYLGNPVTNVCLATKLG